MAPLAALRGEGVAYVILLAGPSVPIAEILVVQSEAIARASGMSDANAAGLGAAMGEAIEAARTHSDPEALAAALRAPLQRQLEVNGITPSATDIDAAVSQAMSQFGSAWFKWILDYDPIPALEALDVPVLALNGSLDMQVLVDQNIPGLEGALRASGNPDVTVTVMPGLNHLFQHASTGSPAEYPNIEETMSEEVLEIVAAWIIQRFSG